MFAVKSYDAIDDNKHSKWQHKEEGRSVQGKLQLLGGNCSIGADLFLKKASSTFFGA